jgi:DNA-binding CsgD family transcriptional regulator
VAGLALRGAPSREIAARLFIGERTVESHLAHIYAKLGVRGRIELLRCLREQDL